VPPAEVRTVVAGGGVGEGAGAGGVADGGGERFLGRGASGVAEELTGGIAAGDGAVSAASLLSAWFTAATVSCWLGVGARLCPRADTASRLPPVAAAAPSSQAPKPARKRALTRPRLTDGNLRAGKADLKPFG
jgi:hypothetical protein